VKLIIGIVVGVVVLAAGAVLVGMKMRSANPNMGPGGGEGTVVRVEPVGLGELVEIVSAPGQVQPKTKVQISARVAARIVELPFDEGQKVTKGNPNANPPIPPSMLVRLDATELEAQMRATEARAAAQKAEIREAQAQIASQEAQIQESFFEFDRLLQLGKPTGQADFAFHRSIAEATNNPFYVEVLDALGARTIPCDVTSPYATEEVLSVSYQAGLQREHLAILNAISAGDATGARDAMRAHLSASQERYRERLRDRRTRYQSIVEAS